MCFKHFKAIALALLLSSSFGISNVQAEPDCGKFFPSTGDIDFSKVFFEFAGGAAFPLVFSNQNFLPMTSFGGDFSAGLGINLGGWLFSLDYTRSMYGEGTNSGALMENFVNNVFGLKIRRVLSKSSLSKLPKWLEIIPGIEAGYDFITTDYYTSTRAKEDGRLTSIGFGQTGAGCFFLKGSLETAFDIGTDWFVPYLGADFNIFRDSSIGGGFGMFWTANIGFRSYPFGHSSKGAKEPRKTAKKAEKTAPAAPAPAPESTLTDPAAPVKITLEPNLYDDFTPDSDGINDSAIFKIQVSNYEEEIAGWKVEIFDPKGALFRSYSGKGLPPSSLQWDGLSDSGEEVFSMNSYKVKMTVTPSAKDITRSGQTAVIAETSIKTGIQMQVIIPNEKWKIIVNTIHFDPDKATFDKISEAQRRENHQTIDSLVKQIKAHPDCLITIEGYANNVSNTERENIEELVPLSKLRANAILKMLNDRGIEKDILTATGKGGANPIAAWKDTASWWKNRRVEFIVQKKK